MPIDYTLVLGVDRKHLEQLALTWPTWIKHKPSLLQHPLLVFYDGEQVSAGDVADVVADHPRYGVVKWPPDNITYPVGMGKFDNQQRHKMLAGFVHVPAEHVQTPYWLKIDTDTVADGNNDWIDPTWFADDPAIVSHPWGFTKPADQMWKLDTWVDANEGLSLNAFPPLRLTPKPGWSRLRHKRIISWCAFFQTQFTRSIAAAATTTCGPCQLPVPSQDGFSWYCAKRMGRAIATPNMKKLGWQHFSTMRNIRQYSLEAMQ